MIKTILLGFRGFLFTSMVWAATGAYCDATQVLVQNMTLTVSKLENNAAALRKIDFAALPKISSFDARYLAARRDQHVLSVDGVKALLAKVIIAPSDREIGRAAFALHDLADSSDVLAQEIRFASHEDNPYGAWRNAIDICWAGSHGMRAARAELETYALAALRE